MLIVRKKREHALLLYFLKSNKKKVAKLHVFRAPKNVHVSGFAEPTLRLLGVPTAQKNALETGSVNAEAGMLLFAILKKSFNERSGCHCLARTRQSAPAR